LLVQDDHRARGARADIEVRADNGAWVAGYPRASQRATTTGM